MHTLTHDDVYRVLAGSLLIPKEKFNPNVQLVSGYNFDSLAIFEIPLLIEEHYGMFIELPDNSLSLISTGKDLADYMVEHQNGN